MTVHLSYDLSVILRNEGSKFNWLKAVADGRREYRSVILRKYSVHRNQKKNDKIPNVSLAGAKDLILLEVVAIA